MSIIVVSLPTTLIGGALGSYLGVRQALWIAAVGQMFVFLPVFFSPLRTMRELHDLEQLAA